MQALESEPKGGITILFTNEKTQVEKDKDLQRPNKEQHQSDWVF